MPVYSWEEWASNQMEISQRLRALADHWDRGLTEARPDYLLECAAWGQFLIGDLCDVTTDMPHTPADVAASRVDLMERDV